MGETAFCGEQQPLVFKTYDSIAERQALKVVFPKSTFLLWAFHLCQALWQWPCESKHGIEKNERQSLMVKFRNILFEYSEKNAHNKMNELYLYNGNRLFANHMSKWKSRMVEWAVLCYRRNLEIHGHNTNK